jgi:hypothetical protein
MSVADAVPTEDPIYLGMRAFETRLARGAKSSRFKWTSEVVNGAGGFGVA